MAKAGATAVKVGDIVKASDALGRVVVGQVVEVGKDNVLVTPGCTITKPSDGDPGAITPAQTYGPFYYSPAAVTVLEL